MAPPVRSLDGNSTSALSRNNTLPIVSGASVGGTATTAQGLNFRADTSDKVISGN